MIDPATSRALARIDAVESDLAGAYAAGFEPRTRGLSAPRPPLPSLDPLSVSAPEGAYFLTGDVRAPRFTRDGCFRLEGGDLRTAGGDPVLGTVAGSNVLVPLRVDAVDRALGRMTDAHIEGDGTFAYSRTSLDPASGRRLTERVCVGRVALARFAAGSVPAANNGSFAAPSGTAVHIGLPGDAHNGGLVTYSRDAGKVDVNAGLIRLQEAYLLLDAVRAAGAAHGNAEKTALDLVK
jgi:hypothetical protein